MGFAKMAAMRLRHAVQVVMLIGAGCVDRGGLDGTGGPPDAASGGPTGGATATGGATSTGGATGTGGATSTGGTTATGGATGTGGISGTGGVSATGGVPGTGGTSGQPDGGPLTCASDDCKGPGPKLPSYICPDGKTTAGPACLPAKDGTCQWQIVQCPKPCVETVLCVRGAHFDGTVCKCVPNEDAGVCVDTVLCALGTHFDHDLCKCVPNVAFSDGGAGCTCSAGYVCVKQIGGPPISGELPVSCLPTRPGCEAPSACSCLVAPGGHDHCQPDPSVAGQCLCDNGIR
jgi:hypothetical protein